MVPVRRGADLLAEPSCQSADRDGPGSGRHAGHERIARREGLEEPGRVEVHLALRRAKNGPALAVPMDAPEMSLDGRQPSPGPSLPGAAWQKGRCRGRAGTILIRVWISGRHADEHRRHPGPGPLASLQHRAVVGQDRRGRRATARHDHHNHDYGSRSAADFARSFSYRGRRTFDSLMWRSPRLAPR